jgi:two-component system, OmpR family, phosphate regulon response regulator PhoB
MSGAGGPHRCGGWRRFAGIMTSTGRAKLILVVDDDDPVRSQYTFGLAFAGFTVSEARSGFEALQKIESQRPDLVLLDSTLHGIDAAAVRAELASNPHTRDIPVIVLTGTGDGFAPAMHGCTVLRKPLATWRVIEAVLRCLDVSGQ